MELNVYFCQIRRRRLCSTEAGNVCEVLRIWSRLREYDLMLSDLIFEEEDGCHMRRRMYVIWGGRFVFNVIPSSLRSTEAGSVCEVLTIIWHAFSSSFYMHLVPSYDTNPLPYMTCILLLTWRASSSSNDMQPPLEMTCILLLIWHASSSSYDMHPPPQMTWLACERCLQSHRR